ncbi:GNAT family N-acetyltransferase [Croceibacter atlanticus]|nr:GNAT family N-acetyltransferase [Croceibacter atlanticus]
MVFPDKYKALKIKSLSELEYSIVPIRYKDRFKIMQWRNEQLFHLRQVKPLTEKDQENYFRNVVAKLFEQEKPNQLLFSYLKNNECIGYGGLVHINWFDKNAEISFIMKTELEKNEFKKNWKIYLNLLEKMAFEELMLHKIYTYAFDLRPLLYEVLEEFGYLKDAVLKDHCLFNGEYKDVIIHSKIKYL